MLLPFPWGCALSAVASPGEAKPPGAEFITDVFSFREVSRPTTDLTGLWEFRRDPDDAGKALGWHQGDGQFKDTIRIPGAPQAQGFGEPNQRQKTFFSEPFWVRRTFSIPHVPASKRVWLRIGGILPAAEVYLNGRCVGYTQSSRTQQRVDVTPFVRAAADNLIAIKVCDFPEVRLDGIWEMGECARTWTGVYRPITCEITDRVSIVDACLQPRLASSSVRVDVDLSELPTDPLILALRVTDGDRTIGHATSEWPPGHTHAQAEVTLDRFTAWSPEHPRLYALEISLRRRGSAQAADTVRLRFGMREISARGAKFYLNGKPIFLRCFGENQYYPETLAPPADKDWYLARLRRARSYGFNGAKGCVEALPQEYIEAADEAGIIIIQEMPFGLSGLRANRYTIDERFREYYGKELEGLVRESRNHASVVAYSMSSELEFSNQTQESFNFFSRNLVRRTRSLAPHALVIDCTGYLDAEDTPKGRRDTDFYASVFPNWMKEVLDETGVHTDGRHPLLLHEYNWWSCYPDPAAKALYAHAQLRPFWLDALVKTARENGQEDLLPTYRQNSLWLQALCRKDGIEYSRRNPDVEGYILWLLVDFGQYAEGLLDDFWNPKNVSPEELLQSNADTVIVLAQEGNRCLAMGTEARIPLAVSHYGPEVLRDCRLGWSTAGPGSQRGEIRLAELKPGELARAGRAEFALPAAEKAYRFELRVVLRRNGKTINTNEWSFWAFPEAPSALRDALDATPGGPTLESGAFLRLDAARSAPIPEGTSLVIADGVDEPLAAYLEGGGKCLLLSRGAVIENTICYHGTTTFYKNFRTIPWNAGTSGNSGTVIAAHPALADFPHEGMCDLQFLSMVKGVLPMEFTPLGRYGVTPIIRAIDHYAANRNNAYLLEFKVGAGSVLAATLGILEQADQHIEARHLLGCLIGYAQGSGFQPSAHVPKDEFLRLFSRRPDA